MTNDFNRESNHQEHLVDDVERQVEDLIEWQALIGWVLGLWASMVGLDIPKFLLL